MESTTKQTAKQTLKKKENCWDQLIDLCVFNLTYFEFALELPAFRSVFFVDMTTDIHATV